MSPDPGYEIRDIYITFVKANFFIITVVMYRVNSNWPNAVGSSALCNCCLHYYRIFVHIFCNTLYFFVVLFFYQGEA